MSVKTGNRKNVLQNWRIWGRDFVSLFCFVPMMKCGFQKSQWKGFDGEASWEKLMTARNSVWGGVYTWLCDKRLGGPSSVPSD